jgi:hypothetical protein
MNYEFSDNAGLVMSKRRISEDQVKEIIDNPYNKSQDSIGNIIVTGTSKNGGRWTKVTYKRTENQIKVISVAPLS